MSANGPYQMASITAMSTVSVGPYRYTWVRVQTAPAARVFSLAPLSAGRPRLPVWGGARVCRAALAGSRVVHVVSSVSYTHLRAHETRHDLVCRLLLEKK